MTEAPTRELDNLDRQLIDALRRDGRASYAGLARSVGMSRSAARDRVNKLLEQVVSVTGRVDPATLGRPVSAFVFVDVNKEVDKTAACIADIEESVFVAVAAGRFDVVAELRCRDEDGLIDALEQIRRLEGVGDLQSATVLDYEKQDWTGIGNRTAQQAASPEVAPTDMLDAIDRRLLVELMVDGRASYSTLALVTGISPGAARDRVKRMLDSKILTIQVDPEPEAMGVGGFAGLAAAVAGPVAPLASALADLPETTVVSRTLGCFDLTAEVWYEDNDHLAEVLDRMRAQPGMGGIQTTPYLRITKDDHG